MTVECLLFLLLRKILFVRVDITRDDAIRRAQGYCQQRGWPWAEPVSLTLYVRKYHFMTKQGYRGGNIFGTGDCTTGEVEAGPPTPR